MLTVLNVSQNHHIRGGSDRYYFALAELLAARGHRVIPFAARHPDNLPSEYAGYFPVGADFRRPGLRDLARYVYSRPARSALGRLLAGSSVDIAHLHIYYGRITASILDVLEREGVPIVQTLHEYKLVCPVYTLVSHGRVCQACGGSAFWHATAKRCNRGSLARSLLSTVESYVSRALGSVSKVAHFIAVSDFLRDKLVELGIPADKVSTVHNFIDVTAIRPSTEPGNTVLYFGRLDRLKGVFTLLDAVAPLKDVAVRIVGDGEARAEIRLEIERRGLDHVRLEPFLHGGELTGRILESVCTVAPSEGLETFGLSLLESFAHGRPVVASRIGGMPEVVTDGVDGFLVPPGDAEALRERILWLVSHRQTAVEMGAAGRRKVETRFTPEAHYRQIAQIYDRVRR